MASTSLLPTWAFLLLIPLFLLVSKKLQSRKWNNHVVLPPGPPRLPIIGNLHQLGALAHQSLWKLSKKYGPVMILKLGNVPTVVISSAEAAKEVFKIHDLDSCSRPLLFGTRKLTYNFKDVGFSPYSEYWRKMQKNFVLELLGLKRVQSFQPLKEEEVGLLIASISQSASSASPVNLSQKMFAFTAGIVFRIAYKRSFKGSKMDNGRFHELVHEAGVVTGGFAASDFFPLGVGWIVDRLTGLYGRRDRIFWKLDSLFEHVIDDHVNCARGKEDDEKEDIIDVLLKIERDMAAAGSNWFTKSHIKAILLNIFLGGIDTSAITITWAMTELIRSPRSMEIVQDEVRRSAGKKGRVTEQDLDQLQYLKMVVKETLRLHPVAPLLIPRETMKHFKIQGYNIYPKTRMHINVWAIGRDPDIWENPEEFNPERFVNSSIDYRGQHFELLPFGAGRRSCPGIHFGLSTTELTLANLLYNFNWKLPDGMKEEDISMEEGVGLTTFKKVPLELVPIKFHWPSDDKLI